ncbi:MAG: 23S rRNA (adenine(2503)-C(2))-methyltransferase RlmN [Ktedonobacterales bacterium]|jgi:23S rRNA (adenine2503-C2)-methyltransferase|nr:MAG: 23S rRNA (adenine(2503)-C(2))-methyltransferase RlmN [Ktedonobacterales bacterium]
MLDLTPSSETTTATDQPTTRADLLGMSFAEMQAWLGERGQPAFRARQLAGWIYDSLVADFAEMRTLPAMLRAQLAREATIEGPRMRTELAAKDGRTRKLLLELADGRLIETVLMLYPATSEGRARATVCVSTQAGCAYGCTFCATGQMGFDRHLTPGEIVAQVIYFARELRHQPWQAPDGEQIDHVTNLVFMGMGEPLHNYDHTLKALRILNMPEGLNIGARHMTVSTVGLVPGILRLAEEPLQVNLAISLHAPNNAMRLRTMPVTRKYPIEAVLDACRVYTERTNRQVTFEYVLLAGENDRAEHARELAQLLSPLKQLCHVNLIPVNATAAGYRPPSGEAIRAFRETLRRSGVSNSVRAERGDDIAAACGQLHTRETRKAAPDRTESES